MFCAPPAGVDWWKVLHEIYIDVQQKMPCSDCQLQSDLGMVWKG